MKVASRHYFQLSPFIFHLSPFNLKYMATLNIKEYLDRDEQKDLLRFLTAGSVDDGKSTLIGRLLFDSKKLYEDHLRESPVDSDGCDSQKWAFFQPPRGTVFSPYRSAAESQRP